jgi:hypothetical protein
MTRKDGVLISAQALKLATTLLKLEAAAPNSPALRRTVSDAKLIHGRMVWEVERAAAEKRKRDADRLRASLRF